MFFVFWNRISLKNLVYIGAHSIDPYERLIADKFNIHLYGMRVSISLMNYEIMKRFIVRRRFNCSEYREALDAMRTGALQVAEHMNGKIIIGSVHCVQSGAAQNMRAPYKSINRLLLYRERRTNIDCICLYLLNTHFAFFFSSLPSPFGIGSGPVWHPQSYRNGNERRGSGE